MLKLYKNLRRCLATLMILGLSFWAQTVQAQCTITTSTPEGCIGVLTNFSSTGPAADSIVWTYPGGSTRSNPALISFATSGMKQVVVTYYSAGGTACTQTLNFNVNDLPVSDFVLDPSQRYSQCYTGNTFCFNDLSAPASGNSIAKRVILYGDFETDSASSGGGSFCHTYSLQIGGCFDVFQRVIDNKGCIGETTKRKYVCVDPDLDVNFTHNTPLGCGQTHVVYNNSSPVPYSRVKEFTWIWGDSIGEDYFSNGSKVDSCFWFKPSHTYTKHGCFDVTLMVENDSGCKDTLVRKLYACNVNPNLNINEASGKDGQCVVGNNFTFQHNIVTYNWPVSFIWLFDDPPSGMKNFDDQNFNNAPHSFTGVGLYTPTFSGTIAGCPFATEVNVMVKGPQATIENKMIPDIVHDSMRHQCEIKDTLYFTNNSSFYMNDQYAVDDVEGATTIYKKDWAILMKLPPVKEYMDLAVYSYLDSTFNGVGYDTFTVNVNQMQKFVVNLGMYENVLDTFFWEGDTLLAVEYPIRNAPMYNNHVGTLTSGDLVVDTLIKFNNFFGAFAGERRGDNTRVLWDFADDNAPVCTTWTKYKTNMWDYSKPVYVWKDPNYVDPVTLQKGYTKFFRGNAERALEPDQSKFTDTTYEWMNCRYSRDPIPKHWYTPGKEQCYIVKLTMTDTTFINPNDSFYFDDDIYYTHSGLDDVWNLEGIRNVRTDSGGVLSHSIFRLRETYQLDSSFIWPAKLNASGDTTWLFSPTCAVDTLGFEYDYTKPKIFDGFDTTYTKVYVNPNVQRLNFCESENTLMLALMPPDASGMKYNAPGGVCFGPAPPYGIYFDWSSTKPGCTQQFVWLNFDSTLDRNTSLPLSDWVPQSQFMLNPTTPWAVATMGMPTWPTTAFYNYPQGGIGDSCGYITVGLRILNGKNPSTNQPCIDEKWYHNMLRYVPTDSRFTLSKGAGCNPLEVDMTLTNELQDSLLFMVYKFVNTAADADTGDQYTEVDSIHRRVLDPVTGQLVNYIATWRLDASGNGSRIDSVSFIPGVGGINACGSELRLKKTRTFTFFNQARYGVQVAAYSTDFCFNLSSDIVMIGFWKDAFADKELICRDEIVTFTDTAKYFLKYPDASGNPYLNWGYWRKPNENFNPDGTARTWPQQKRESVRWDFGQDDLGWVFMPAQPQIKYDLPGYYEVMVEFTDSLGCADTVIIPLNVTGTTANFDFSLRVEDCIPIVNFTDMSEVYDPCFIRDNIKCDSIVRYWWEFGDGSGFTTTYTVNGPPNRTPSYKYRNFGDFDVRLIVETALGCRDTLVRTINIEGPRPKFEFAIDSVGCVPFTVYLRNTSQDPLPSAFWVWSFGDGEALTTNSDSTIYHTYDTVGTFDIILYQREFVGLAGAVCVDTFPKAIRKQVRVLPQRDVDFTADRIDVCPNEPITFTDKSDTSFTVFTWIFGDGDTLTDTRANGADTVTHSYASPGTYIVRMRPSYTPLPGDPLCSGSKTLVINVRDLNADFTIDTTGMPIFKFTNTSTNGKNYWWNFDDGNGFQPCPQVDPVNCPDAVHDFADNKGEFRVCLVAQSPEGCYDTACKYITNTFDVSIFVPNVFTPNGDGSNDNFEVQVKGWLKYEIQIFNRQGEKVFESNDPNTPWNGKNFNTGNPNTAGVYYVVIKYQLRGESEKTYNGTVTLIK